jgi:type IV pilus assembly protein PilQ
MISMHTSLRWLKFPCLLAFLFSGLLLLVPRPCLFAEETVSQELVLPQEKCSMRFVDADVRDVLRLLAKEYGLNLVLSETVKGVITLDFEQVALADIFHSVLHAAGLGYAVRGNVVLIAPEKELRAAETDRLNDLEKQTESQKKIIEAQQKEAEAREAMGNLTSKMVKVKYIFNTRATESIAKELAVAKVEVKNLTQLAESLRKMLSTRKGASIEVVDSANAIIVTDIAERVDQIVALVEELDVPSPQIMVEARITAVDTNYARELGIQWGGRAGETGLVVTGQRSRDWSKSTTDIKTGTGNQTAVIGSTDDTGSTFAVDLPAAVGQGAGGTIGLLFGDIQNDFLDVQLSALEDKGRAKLLASPKVITQDNQKAYIKIGEEIPYQQKTIASGVITTDLQFKDAAIELEVSPHTVGDEVFMDLVVARKTPDYANAIQGNPPLRAQAVTTKVSVKSGRTFALGGLTLEEDTKTTNAVPFFSRVPLLGWLFKKDAKGTNKRELIIFITPTIIEKN